MHLKHWNYDPERIINYINFFLPRVVDFSRPLQCTFIRMCCFKPEKVQKRKGLGWALAENAMSLKRTNSFLMVSWGRKSYIITLWVCVCGGPSPVCTASIQHDTEGEVSKILRSLKFNGNWDLQSEIITYQTLGNLYRKETL